MTALRRLAQSRFFRGVVAIAGGTAVAQAVGVLLSPIITRLYTPEAMGLWGLFVSFLGVAAVVATLRYEIAIVAASSEEDALALTRSSLVLGIFTGLFSVLILEVMRRNDVLGYGHLPPWVSLLAFPAVVAFAWGTALRYYSVRKGAFGLVGRFTVTQGVARPFAQIFFSPFGGAGLLLGEVAGRFLGLTALWRVLPKRRGAWFFLDILKKYKVYPLIQLPSGFLNTLALMAPVPVFTALYGSAIGGNLALAQRVIALPVSLVGAAVADVFYGHAAELMRRDPKALRLFFFTTVSRLFLLATLFGFFLWLLAPRMVPWIFGAEWDIAGKMMAIMSPWMVAQLTVSPVSRIVFLSQWQWVKFLYDGLALGIFAFVFIAKKSSFITSLKTVVLMEVALYLAYFAILVWVTGRMAIGDE